MARKPQKSLSLPQKSHKKVLIGSCNLLIISAANGAEKGNYKKTTKNYLVKGRLFCLNFWRFFLFFLSFRGRGASPLQPSGVKLGGKRGSRRAKHG